jgi:hypothetical protein
MKATLIRPQPLPKLATVTCAYRRTVRTALLRTLKPKKVHGRRRD